MAKKLLNGLFFILCLTTLLTTRVSGTHLMGGELTYTYDGASIGGNFYLVKLIVYRYCDSTSGGTAPLDAEMNLGLYVNDTLDPAGPKVWYSTEILYLASSDFVVSNPVNSTCTFTSTACIERGEYYVSVFIPDNPGGYHLVVERCCRNGNIINVNTPGNAGMSFYGFIPTGIINSTPQFSDISVPYVCFGDTTSLINNAFDPDGDSLAYSFVVPFNGYSGPSNPIPDPMIDNNPYTFPIPEISYASGYSFNSFLGAGSFASIDPITGLTRYYFPSQGFYVAAIEIKEYRNGILISSVRRDIQFISIPCTPNTLPAFNPAAGGSSVFTIPEGQPLCFNVSFSDADGDSLYLNASGSLLDPTIVNPSGIISNAVGDSLVSSQFCWTPVCGMSRPSPYQFIVSVTDNGCPAKTTNQVFSVYVTNGPASLVPTVSISQFPTGIICSGSSASFIANATLSGNDPVYIWEINGVISGTDSSVLNAGIINNGDIINVTMISNASCALVDTVYSLPFVANISPVLAPVINITSNPATVLCPQQICLFTANVTNVGTAPSYQWYLNGVTTGTNNNALTAASPSGTMAVYVEVTPSTGCPPEISNAIVFNIVPNLVPKVDLTASVYDTICPGEQVVFSAVASNTGATPIYSWSLNGVNIGVLNDTLILNSLQDGDVVNVSVTSSYPCLSPDFAYGIPLIFHYYTPLSGNLTDGPIDICKGLPVQLNMTANGGKIAAYQYNWSPNNNNISINNFVPAETGYYYATVSDACYDPVIDSILINVLPVPKSLFSWNPLVPNSFYPLVQFSDFSIDAISWEWNLDVSAVSMEQNPSHSYDKDGLHPVRLVTLNNVGCSDTLIQTLEFEYLTTTYVPNSFTPNGDGINDLFGVEGNAEEGYTMEIFNRWGAAIFTADSKNIKWNGLDSSGKQLPSGVYIYIVNIRNAENKKTQRVGTVTLIR